MACSIAGALDLLVDRWAVVILRDLMFGLSKYQDFLRSTGATSVTLTDRLRRLENHGMIQRRRYQVNPSRFEYLLTAKGKDTTFLMQALAEFGDKWSAAGQNGPPYSFVDQDSGRRVKLALVDEGTGKPLDQIRVSLQEGPGADDLVRWRLSQMRKEHSPISRQD